MGSNKLKTTLKNIYWGLYGVTISNPGMPDSVQSILFVCKGNICRSPFAEQFAVRNFHKKFPLKFYSVGIHVDYPKPPPEEAIIAAKHFGIDMTEHRSRGLEYNLMESYDIIVVMETWQSKYLKKIFQEFKEKIFLLPLFEKTNLKKRGGRYFIYNIKDPYGKNELEFKECYKRISSCLEQLLSIIHNNTLLKNMPIASLK